jgi:hypothetical protein
MAEAVVAFAFGVPNTLVSNRRIAAIATKKAKSLAIPVYTQYDVTPMELGIEIVLTEENYPVRVPTLRIARGAVAWAKSRGIDKIWLCAATPHLSRAARDLGYAASQANLRITIEICEGIRECAYDSWFCRDSTQTDTRLKWVWCVRDSILMHAPMWLYAQIAG